MTTYSDVRGVHKQAGSYLVTLPKSWVEAQGLDKGSKVIMHYNGSITITPLIIEQFKVEVEGNLVWFIEGEKRAGLPLEKVKELADRHGKEKTLEIIKEGLVKRGFSDLVPIEKMREKLFPEKIEFVE